MDIFAQTLTKLDLAFNNIGDRGVQELANGLMNNMVNVFVAYSILHILLQAITNLNLNFNTFGDTGAQHFVDVIRTNTVITVFNVNISFTIVFYIRNLLI